MGILKRIGAGWLTTEKGSKFSLLHKNTINCDAFHHAIVDEIIKYLSKDNLYE